MYEISTGQAARENNPDRNGTFRILVTGGAGFIGSHVVDALLARYPRAAVTVLDAFTYAADARHLSAAAATGRLRLVRGSVEDAALVRRLARGASLVCHLAAESHVPRSFCDPELFDRVNRQGTRNVLLAAGEAAVKRVLHFSTDEVYGSRLSPADEDAVFAPTSPYSVSKARAETEVESARRAGLDVVIVRPSNVVGPRQHAEKLLPRFIQHGLTGRPFPVEGTGRQRRTFLAVSDAARATLHVLERGRRNGTYNVAGEETLSVIGVAGAVADILGIERRLDHVDDRPVNDQAYMLDGSRLRALGFRPEKSFFEAAVETVQAMTGGPARMPRVERPAQKVRPAVAAA